MARTISSTLLAAQSASGKPHIQAVFKSRAGATLLDASTDQNKLLQLEHHEEPYSDYATIVLQNAGLNIPNLVGGYVDLAYGFETGINAPEPNGNNAGDEYAYTPRLWVKKQDTISAQGQLLSVLHLGGVWTLMAEQLLRLGNPPLYDDEDLSGQTIYAILERIIETELSLATGYTFTLSPLGTQDDGIISSYSPALELNPVPYESMSQIIQILMAMTQCYIRSEASLNFRIIWPQATDAPDETYYSNQVHYFTEVADRRQVITPNHVIVFANAGEDGSWANYITGEAWGTDDFDASHAYTGSYMEVKGLYQAATIDNASDADNRAAAILAKAQAEATGGRLIIFNDSRVELYDRPAVFDYRGT